MTSSRRGWQPEEPRTLPRRLTRMLDNGILLFDEAQSLARLRRKLALSSGQRAPIVLAALGASITGAHAGVFGRYQDRFALGYTGLPSWCTGACVKQGWLTPAWSYLTGDRTDHADAYVNCGLGGHSFASYRDCMATSIPSNADIFLVDAAVTWNNQPNAIADVERVLRRLLLLPTQPAVIMLHFLNWCQPHERFDVSHTTTRHMHREGTCYTPELLARSNASARRIEGALDRLARHYMLPVLSVSRALMPAAMRGELASQNFTLDGIHPSETEGGRVYTRLIAALITRFLQRARSGPSPTTDSVKTTSVPCKPIHRAAAEAAFTIERCYMWGNTGKGDVALLPPTVLESKGWQFSQYDTATSFAPPDHCRGGKQRSKSLLPTKSVASTRWACPKAKPGYTALTAGARVDFELALPADSGNAGAGTGAGGGAAGGINAYGGDGSSPTRRGTIRYKGQRAELTTYYLSSYEGHGIAQVACVDGCHCKPVRIDSHRGPSYGAQRYASLWDGVRSRVTLSGQKCHVSVEVLNTTSSGGFKFKLRGLIFRWQLARQAAAGGVQTEGAVAQAECFRDGARQSNRVVQHMH